MLMLSATPVNNRFNDLKNQLALAYEGESENLRQKLDTDKDIEEIFRQAQRVFNEWSKLPPEERTADAILKSLDFDFFELLDASPSPARASTSRPSTTPTEIGSFPERLKPISFHCPLTHRTDVIGFNEIFEQLSMLTLAVYAPLSYVLPSRLAKYEELYDTEVERRPRQPRAGRPRAEPPGADDGQPAQAAGKLGRGVPAHASASSTTTITRTLAQDRAIQEGRRRCRRSLTSPPPSRTPTRR